MKKKCILTGLLSLLCALSWGQVAEWLIPPKYDKMFIAPGSDLIQTDSLGQVAKLWSFEGKMLAPVIGDIKPFKDGYALIVDNKTNRINGLIDTGGHYVSTDSEKYKVAKNYPYVSCGYLLLSDSNLDYRYMDTSGKIFRTVYSNAYPFLNEYASCRMFLNQDKNKDSQARLLDKNLAPVGLKLDGKVINWADVNFVSSVNSEHIGVIIIKKKVYLFDTTNGVLSMICARKDVVDKKTQAKVQEENESMILQIKPDHSSMILAKCGRAGDIILSLDPLRQLRSINYIDGEITFPEPEPQIQTRTSFITKTKVNDLFGIDWKKSGRIEVLPPQFEEAPICFDDKAIVKVNGKYGLIKVHRDETFGLSMNKKMQIPFKHRTFETTARLDMPSFLPSGHTLLEIDPASGCEVDKTSGEGKDTPHGNYLEYNCVLQFPQELFTQDEAMITYPAQVIYEDLKSPVIPLQVRGWHYKYLNVVINEEDKILDKGCLSFIFNIERVEKNDEPIYRLDVKANLDSLSVDPIKINEIKYQCIINQLADGLNNLNIVIQEDGCPPIVTPYEIFYTKPVEKTRYKPAVKEEVKISKKEPAKIKM